MVITTGKKVLAGVLVLLVGLVVALSQCRSCRERLKKAMMTKMRAKMPNMMEKMIGKLSREDQIEMATHCKTMFTEMEDKLKKE